MMREARARVKGLAAGLLKEERRTEGRPRQHNTHSSTELSTTQELDWTGLDFDLT